MRRGPAATCLLAVPGSAPEQLAGIGSPQALVVSGSGERGAREAGLEVEQDFFIRFIGVVEPPRWCSDEKSTCQCRRCKGHGFDPWVGKIPGSGKWQPTPLCLLRKFHGQRSLAATVHGVPKSRT